MVCSMDAANSEQDLETSPAPAEERAARHLRVLARLTKIQMEVIEATRTEALEAPQPGADYCQRIAGIARSVRLTVLLEERMAEKRREARRRAAGRRVAVAQADRPLRVFLAMAAAIDETAGSEDEDARLCHEIHEYLERPEVAERVESSPAPAIVAELCRKYRLPEETEWWLSIADAAMEELGYLAPGDDPPDDPPPPERHHAAARRNSPDTG
jgi:hypothetical protein